MRTSISDEKSVIIDLLKITHTLHNQYFSQLFISKSDTMAFIQVPQISFESEACAVNGSILIIESLINKTLLQMWSQYLASWSLMTKWSYLVIWLLLFKQRRMPFKQIKVDSFVERVAKNNS